MPKFTIEYEVLDAHKVRREAERLFRDTADPNSMINLEGCAAMLLICGTDEPEAYGLRVIQFTPQ